MAAKRFTQLIVISTVHAESSETNSFLPPKFMIIFTSLGFYLTKLCCLADNNCEALISF